MDKIKELEFGEYKIRYNGVFQVIEGNTDGNQCLLLLDMENQTEIRAMIIYYEEDQTIEVRCKNYTLDEKVIELELE